LVVQMPQEASLPKTSLNNDLYPERVGHWLQNKIQPARHNEWLSKYNPATGKLLTEIARGQKEDAAIAIDIAVQAYPTWSQTSVIRRAEILRNAALLIQNRQDEIATIVSLETGKSKKDALGEVGAAIEMGYFVAGEGRRFYGKTTTSGVPNRTAMIVRQSLGPCALIIAANTPAANVAWKVFPALLCGNTAILKASEDTPYSAVWFAQILQEAGLPEGVLSVLQGDGEEVGAPLVESEQLPLVSFTGSVPVGRWIAKTGGARLAKVCLELGGKNALVVCDDADLDTAVDAAVLSAFSNAGQRCASGSRVILFESIADQFTELMLKKTKALKLGFADSDDLGAVINENQLNHMLTAVSQAVTEGATLLCGGKRLDGGHYQNGYYLEPTILVNVSPSATISNSELFGPITCLYRVQNLEEAIQLNNNSPFGLTAAIHTQSIHRAEVFQQRSQTGVVSINGPTYGSEPHLPFGGLRQSGNGFREAGGEAMDVYSDWKTIYTRHDPNQI